MNEKIIGFGCLVFVALWGAIFALMFINSPNWAYFAIGFFVVVLILDRVALLMESRGWIYYRRTRSAASITGAYIRNLSVEMSALLNPAIKHVDEARHDHGEHEDHGGEPPEPADSEER